MKRHTIRWRLGIGVLACTIGASGCWHFPFSDGPYEAIQSRTHLTRQPERNCFISSFAQLQKTEAIDVFEYESMGSPSDQPQPKRIAVSASEEGQWPARFRVNSTDLEIELSFEVDLYHWKDGEYLEMGWSVRSPAPPNAAETAFRQMRKLEGLILNNCQIGAVSPSMIDCALGEKACPT